MLRLRRVLVLAAAAVALSTTGCVGLISGENDTDVHLNIKQGAHGSFSNWNEITIQQDINAVTSATLLSIDFTVTSPAGGDLTFLTPPLTAEAVTPSKRTLVATLDKITPGEATQTMHVDYFDDMHALFRDNHTIRVEWSGALNPAYTNWPANGIDITATIKIDIE